MASMNHQTYEPTNAYQEERESIYRHQPLSYHYEREYIREPLYYRAEPEREEILPSRLWSLLRTNGAVIAVAVALVAILFTHHLDDLRGWGAYYFPRDVALTDSLGVLALQALQYIIGWVQYFFSGDIWERVYAWTCRKGATLGSASLGTDQGSARNILGRLESLPELEPVTNLPESLMLTDLSRRSADSPMRRVAQMNTAPLQPAFLREADYPTNWMVYHPVLGVVKRSDALDYDRKVLQANTPVIEEEEGDAPIIEEKMKDGPEARATDLDEEKTVHRSNVSLRSMHESVPGVRSDDSSSSSENGHHSSSFPVLHSIAATG